MEVQLATHEDGDGNRPAFYLNSQQPFCPCVVGLFLGRGQLQVKVSAQIAWELAALESSSVRQQQSFIGVLTRQIGIMLGGGRLAEFVRETQDEHFPNGGRAKPSQGSCS